MNKDLCYLVFLFIIAGACNQSGNEDSGSKGSAKKISKSLDLYLPDDLEATLWAQSPMFYNPTNMDVDNKGRIWITEAVNYRNFNNDSTKFYDRKHSDL